MGVPYPTPRFFSQSASNCVHLHTWNTVNLMELEMSLLFSMETSLELPFAATNFPGNNYEVYSTKDILYWLLKQNHIWKKAFLHLKI